MSLRSGSAIPADCKLQRNSQIQVDQAVLTGESVPATLRRAAAPSSTHSPLRRRREHSHSHASTSEVDDTSRFFPLRRRPGDMAKMGCTVLQGDIEAIVVATGRNTALGKTAELLTLEKGGSVLQGEMLTVLLALVGAAGVVSLAVRTHFCVFFFVYVFVCVFEAIRCANASAKRPEERGAC